MNKYQRHGITVKDLVRFFIMLPVLIALITFVKRGVEMFAEDSLPAEYFVQYDKIETFNYAYPAGTKSIFVHSYLEVKKDGLDINWNDELHCTTDDKYWIEYGVQPWDSIVNKKDSRTKPVVWTFNIELPNKDVICKIISNITITLQSGRHKTMIVESNEFMVAPDI